MGSGHIEKAGVQSGILAQVEWNVAQGVHDQHNDLESWKAERVLRTKSSLSVVPARETQMRGFE